MWSNPLDLDVRHVTDATPFSMKGNDVLTFTVEQNHLKVSLMKIND